MLTRICAILPLLALLNHLLASAMFGQSFPTRENLRTTPSGKLALPFTSSADHAQAKVAPELLELRRVAREGELSESFRIRHPILPLRGQSVVIDAVAEDLVNGEGIALAVEANAVRLHNDLRSLGLRNTARYGRVVSGLLPIAAIDRLLTLESLRFARPAYAISNAGLTTSQADVATNADDTRTLFGIDGSGVTIGTLSDSYNCLGGAATDIANGDLPASVNVLAEISSCTGAIDEGRAMMQLIHDLAPGSSQEFHSAFNGMADFAAGIVELATVGNSDVIVDDILYFAEPMFQDGIVAQAVDTVVGMGVPYFSSAGNSGADSYESAFRQSGLTVFGNGEAHDFDPGVGTDLFHQITLPVGATLTITLQWDSPFFSVSGAPGSPNNLDIYLTDDPPTVGVASSQVVNTGGDAVEVMQFFNNGASGTTFNVVIEGVSGPVPGLIKYIINTGGTINEFDTDSSTIYGHANAAGASAVGAAAYFDTPEFGTSPALLESFSSVGRTPILFDLLGNPVNISRQKPNLVCVDGTNTTFFGSDFEPDGFPNFFGTSAAAPHAAVIAGLMLDLEPTLTPAAIYNALESTALDMGAAGVDDQTGHGLCQADLAVAAVAVGSISVTKTASPTSVPEPGASVTFTARVDNTGNTAVSLTVLADDVHGDLNGQGTCAVPQAVAIGGFYQCSFTATVSGDAGGSETGTLTASGTSPAGAVQDTDSATVTVTDVIPTLTVTKTASPESVPEPGGNVTFTVRVDNTSVESVDLTTLTDDIHGNLNGQGTCSVPQTIATGAFYQCSFTAAVNGNAGDSETDTVTAAVEDNEDNRVQGNDLATVAITDVLPALNVTKTANPTSVPEPGGAVTFVVEIANLGATSDPLTLTSLVDDIHGDLNGRGTCSVPQSIVASSSYECAFTATVTGAAGTSETDTVTAFVQDDEGNAAQASDTATVTIVGPAAPEIDVTPTSLIFARRGISLGASGSQVVTVENIGTDPLSITSIARGGSDASDFLITSDTGETMLAPGASRIIEIAFDPQSIGAKSAFLRVQSNDASEPIVDVALRGEGILASGPEIEVSPLAMSFGPIDPAAGSTPAQNLLVSNQGSSNLSFTLRLAGSDAGEFGYGGIALSGNGNSVTINADSIDVTLTPGSSFRIGVRFDPTSTGEKSGLVTIDSNDTDETFIAVVLTGNGGALDYGDAPDSDPSIAPTTYPTLLSTNGARHALGSGLFLGAGVDADANGQPNGSASGDDSSGTSDEDGVAFSSIGRGFSATVDVTASAPGLLNAWVDWNQDGDWLDAAEQIFTDEPLAAGLNAGLIYSVPPSATLGASFARFRVSTDAGLAPMGLAPDGEVEDHAVTIEDLAPSSISVTTTALPTNVSEPGGPVVFTVRIDNTSSVGSVTLESVVDDVHGNLDDQGNCMLPQVVPAGAFYQCQFTANVAGNASAVETNTVTVTGDGVGGSVNASDSATVTIVDVLPALRVTKTASPTSVTEPGGNVTFTMQVENTSVEVVTLTGLSDDVHGDLNGQGTCMTSGSIAIGGSYTCEFTVNVNGNAGDSETSTATATVEDDEGNSVQGADSATVNVIPVLIFGDGFETGGFSAWSSVVL